MFSKLRAMGRHVIVAWEDFDVDERGRQFVPGTDLVYGRTVHPPVARILQVAPGVYGFHVGQRIIATKDVNGLFSLGGVEVQAIQTEVWDERRGRWRATYEIAAILGEMGPQACQGRVIGTPVRGEASEVLGVVVEDWLERLRVESARSYSGVRSGCVVVLRRQSPGRVEWTDKGRVFVSVLDTEVLAVEELPLAGRR